MLFSNKKTNISMVTLFVFLITGGIFTILTSVRNQEKFRALDNNCSQSLYNLKSLPNHLMLLFDRLGSGFFTVPLGLMLFFSYKHTNEHSKARIILYNVIGIRLLNSLFKQLFKRKPPKWERLVEASKYGYPSAHTMNAAGFYGLILFLTGLRKNIWGVFGTFLLLMMIGLSRVKLGIHFIADVIAGLAAGIFINLLTTIKLNK